MTRMQTVPTLIKPTGRDEDVLERMTSVRTTLTMMALDYIKTGSTGTVQERMRAASQNSGLPVEVLSTHFHRDRPRQVFRIPAGSFKDRTEASQDVTLHQKVEPVDLGKAFHFSKEPTEFE